MAFSFSSMAFFSRLLGDLPLPGKGRRLKWW
jgi:hypothetical protein